MVLAVNADTSANDSGKQVKNVILLIPDGMSITHTTIARWYKGGTALSMDSIASGLVRTYSADATIADSAPAATAMATGYKSHTGFVSVLPDVADMPGQTPINPEDARKPVATVLEGAKLLGKATGLIATSEIPHATPAAFASHNVSRKNYDSISEQMVYNGIDVVFGGGSDTLKNKRKDGEDLIEVLKAKGYEYITTKEQMQNVTSNKVWGMFAQMDMAYDMDRDASVQPSLAEMTQKAIDILSKDEDGFFLMVEGSKIDWASHANDPVGVISDVLAFDEAVKVALDFAKSNGNTAVIVCSDHGNGGMTIGNSDTTHGYDKKPLSAFIAPLKKAKLTGEGLESKLNKDKSNIKEVMAQYFGITDLSNEEIKAIKEAKPGSLNGVVGPIISKRAFIGWTTGGHTGEEVVLYSYHPNSAYRLTGVVENTDIAKYIAELLSIDLEKLNRTLFVPARAAFEAKGATVEYDNTTDPANPVIIVTKGSNTLKLPVNKNIAILNGETKTFNGLTVVTSKTFVPQEVVDMIE